MEKRIFNCAMFNNYINKEYKIVIKHKIFGENKMVSVINGFVEDEDRIGVVAHGKEIFCYKNDNDYKFIEENDRVVVSDGLMEIFIYI